MALAQIDRLLEMALRLQPVGEPGLRFGERLLVIAIGRVGRRKRLDIAERARELGGGLGEAALLEEQDAEIGIGILLLHPPLHIVGAKLDHSVAEPLVFAHRGFGLGDPAELARNVAGPKDVLGVIVDRLRFVGLAPYGFRRPIHRLPIEALGPVQVAAKVGDFRHRG